MSFLKLTNIEKNFGDTQAIKKINLEIFNKEFVVFVGPSGCGKSTLLRLIAGLETIDAGRLELEGEDITYLSPSKRNLAMVFQSYALYPHMNVFDNMSFSLRLAKKSKSVITEKVKETAKILELTPYLKRLPKELSGGQRQRVAIGRAIIRNPRVFLFDEPLSNLDAALRTQTRVEIANLHKNLKTTTIYVTHDQVEAMTLADRVVVLRGGNIEQVGTPLELFDKPANQFVAEFIGSPKMNINSFADLPTTLKNKVNSFLKKQKENIADQVKTIGYRPEAVYLQKKANGLAFSAEVVLIENLGMETLIYLKMANGATLVCQQKDRVVKRIKKVEASIDFNKLYFFDAEGKTLN